MSEFDYWDNWQYACRLLTLHNIQFDSYYALGYIKVLNIPNNMVDILENINEELEEQDLYLVLDEGDDTLALEEL